MLGSNSTNATKKRKPLLSIFLLLVCMKRIAVLEKDKCDPVACGNRCQKKCPVNRTGGQCIVTGPDTKPIIDETLCTGCGICPKICPFGAIHIINLPSSITKDPIHKYGKNGFHLYNLPTPIFGKVVGLLGVNGIGKSTAIKILAGVLQANFGDVRVKKIDLQKMIDYFKGTEAQNFFEKMRDGVIKVSYKPQAVDMIPKTSKGTVRELLSKVNEKNSLETVAVELQINNILDSDITKISGGELQRVAIAATVLKKANVYIFDEPTSYLDIKQRLRVSQFIKNLADENTGVLVIEHDLIALDFMTDLIHIMYGKTSAYGVVSSLKTTREGINAYLDGFLKEDNVRFRDYQIRFDDLPPNEAKKIETMTTWTNMQKTLGSFSLTAHEGLVHRQEIIGVLGENGIGKTTFVKLLAGVDKPDSGDTGLETGLKVSYKPQYIDSSSDDTVEEVLKDAIAKYTNELIRPLAVEPLMRKKICELSGGELQRTAIALALSRDADIVLLDEPSAHLDVEQRLIVSKVIHRMVEQTRCSAIVVDHDLLFLDYLSERLIVFDGVPAKQGNARGPFSMEKGMNTLLGDLRITLRRDQTTGRPRINKDGSRKDQEQKGKGNFYYS